MVSSNRSIIIGLLMAVSAMAEPVFFSKAGKTYHKTATACIREGSTTARYSADKLDAEKHGKHACYRCYKAKGGQGGGMDWAKAIPVTPAK